MDLNKIKNNWKDMDQFSDEDSSTIQNRLKSITSEKYTNNIKKIAYLEIVLSLGYLYILFFLIAFNEHFVSQTLKLLSYVGILLAIVLPALSLSNVYMFYKTGKLSNSYADTLKLFKQQCKRFNKLQYVLIGLNMTLLLLCVILIPRAYSESLTKTQITIAFVICGLVASWFSFRIWKFYKKQIMRNEDLLENLGSDLV